jgi:hypothetical protein
MRGHTPGQLETNEARRLYVPFASGTPPDRAASCDTSDAAIIGTNLCPTLRSF